MLKLSGKHIRHTAARNYCLVVIPTYNEAMNIERLLAMVLAQGPKFDVLVIDDNSPDGTGTRVLNLVGQTPRVQLLTRPGKQGLGTAYRAGFNYAISRGYPYVIQMDADFSHQPKYLPRMLSLAEQQYDVVIGSRNIAGGGTKNWPRHRQLLSKGGSLYARLVLNMPIYDLTGGFKCFRTTALQQIGLEQITSNGYAFQVEMNYRCWQAGLRMKETPIVFVEREAGVSKMSGRIIREAALKVVQLRFSGNPYRTRELPILPEQQSAK